MRDDIQVLGWVCHYKGALRHPSTNEETEPSRIRGTASNEVFRYCGMVTMQNALIVMGQDGVKELQTFMKTAAEL